MTDTIVLAVLIFALAAVGLGLGVLFGRRPIAGSCGGIACAKHGDATCAGGCRRDSGKEG